ncbi:hypothetical protein SKAU_G00120200 [Synaphobranchus kaupii]|uniref:Galectin n=1 Tax=Synaphobranchus kaupii TaxID=118154 RepID=A0A9Q1FNM3_SYNKA|nr:hypothetical protein SKAU_G00120200 [Synaphobranchus kaupii]
MHLTVIGVIKPDPVRFSINVGHSESDLGMHFNPRFNYSVDTNTIIMNSRKGGWQEEVKDSNFPFHAGQEFKVRPITGRHCA